MSDKLDAIKEMHKELLRETKMTNNFLFKIWELLDKKQKEVKK